AWEDPTGGTDAPGPFWRIRSDTPDDQGAHFQLWRQRAFPATLPACFAELRWWPPLPEPIPTLSGTALEQAGADGTRARAATTEALAALRHRHSTVQGALQSHPVGR